MESAFRRADTIWLSCAVLTARTLCLGGALAIFGLAHMYGYDRPDRALATVVAALLIIVACWRRGGTLAWVALVVGLMGFLELRTVADDLGMPLHTEDIRQLEQILFLGISPSHSLQSLLFVPGRLSLLDQASAIVYWSYFFAPYLAVLCVWLVSPRRTRELAMLLVLTFAAGLVIYALLPGTPPWLASAQEGAPKIYRIMHLVGSSFDPRTYEQVYRSIGDPNPVACLPSVHFAITFMLFLYGRGWGRPWAIAGALYSLAMLWALVYLGEHYVVDCIFGALVAWGVWRLYTWSGRAWAIGRRWGDGVPRWLGHDRRSLVKMATVAAGCAILAVGVVALLLWNGYLALHMYTDLHMNDFGKFYYSAQSFLRGEDMYAPTPATLVPVTDWLQLQFWNLNPPHFHLPLLPLALLEPGVALAIWIGASLLALAVSIGLVVREVWLKPSPWQLGLAVIGLLAFAGTGAVCVTGQLSWLLLLLVTLLWVEARRGRWVRAGLWLGLVLSVKPFFLIFLPYLLLRRQLRTVAASLAATAACFSIGLVVFGLDAHRSWLAVLGQSGWEWASMNGSIMGWLARALDSSPNFAPLLVAPGLIAPLWLALAGLVGVVTVVAAALGRGQRGVDRAFALLLVASQLISPLGWIYYLWLPLGPAVAVFAAAWRERSERTPAGAALWRDRFALAAVPGLVWPFVATPLLQPNPLATVTVGSLYFWSTMALWLALVADWLTGRSVAGRRSGPMVQ